MNIKIRAWDRLYKKMTKWEQFKKEATMEWFEDISFIAMQFIGLQDKNGVDIYEGDICKVSGEEPYVGNYLTTGHDWGLVMVVVFEYGAFQLRAISDNKINLPFVEVQRASIEVLGNIYENHELMEVE